MTSAPIPNSAELTLQRESLTVMNNLQISMPRCLARSDVVSWNCGMYQN
jgi:hypothetical protein